MILRQVCRTAAVAGPVHVLIGGPPRQGSLQCKPHPGNSSNPNNRLVGVFRTWRNCGCGRICDGKRSGYQCGRLRQAAGKSRRAWLQHFADRMNAAGYSYLSETARCGLVYGVPQYRSRFFLLGLQGSRIPPGGIWVGAVSDAGFYRVGCANGYVTCVKQSKISEDRERYGYGYAALRSAR